ncbi:MAG: aldehyde dehydrogenase family protein [Solirubrobacterales bacterium]
MTRTAASTQDEARYARPRPEPDALLRIGGAAVAAAAGERFLTRDPSTGEGIAEVARAGVADVETAVAAARRAQPEWAARDAEERVAVLVEAGRLLRERSVALGRLEALDAGKPVDQAIEQVELTAGAFEYWARTSQEIRELVMPTGPRALNYTLREPLGVIGVITPWNYPMLEYAESLPGALVLGNAVVLKPAELTPLTALALADVLAEAGLPDGVLNVIPGSGSVVGQALVEHADVEMAVFTGSTSVGRRVAAAAGEGLKRTWLELGGKSPNVVFADADLGQVVGASLFSFTVNQGQLCTAGTRLFAAREVHDELVERLRAAAAELTVGDPFEPGTKLGALISPAQVATVEGYVERGREEGARLESGGRRPELDGPCAGGSFYTPTIFTGVRNEMTIAREEIFGPVLSVIGFEAEEEAVAMANDSSYGLNAALWTNDLTRAHRVARALQAGTVYVNTINGGASAPHDRYKGSGLGIAGSREQLEAMTRVKSVFVNLGGGTPSL